jgi:hypothetical protein
VDPELIERVLARRLRAQRLTGAPCATPEEAVGLLLGVQAQDFGSAKWSLGTRVAGATDADVEDAFGDGRILRTHVLRPTWHFALPADLRWLLTATAPRVTARDARRYAQLGLDDATRDRAAAAVIAALGGGRAFTRAEMAGVLQAEGVSADGQRLPYLLMSAELAGLVCSGPRRGKQHTYMLLDERAPEARGLPRGEALAELAARFFAGHGPATEKDLAWWASLTLAEVRAAIEHAGERLRREDAGGLVLWAVGEEDAAASPTLDTPAVHLVQGYDEYLMGYAETRWMLARPGTSWRGAAPPVGSLLILLDGRLAGSWRRTLHKDHVAVEADLRGAWTPSAREALAAEAGRFASFINLKSRLTVNG